MLQKIRSTIYHVPDITAAKEWYSQLLGVTPYFEMPFYVGFKIKDFELGLDPDMTNVTTGTSTYSLWNVDDIEATVEKVISLNGSVHTPITAVGEGMKVAVVKDKWDNCIGLIEEKLP